MLLPYVLFVFFYVGSNLAMLMRPGSYSLFPSKKKTCKGHGVLIKKTKLSEIIIGKFLFS